MKKETKICRETKRPKNKWFEENKKILEMEFDFFQRKHELKMQQLAYERESNRLAHERDLERNRIKSAEIRKSQFLKDQLIRSGQR